MENLNSSLLKSQNRKLFYDIWQKYKAKEKLEGEEKTIAELMALHKDWYNYWESTDFDREFDPDTEFDPYIHITYDTIIMNQINAGDPEQARLTYNKLTARGDSHLKAIHKMARVFVDEFFQVIKHEKEFNNKSYIRKLKSTTDY